MLFICSCVYVCDIELVTAFVENKGHVFNKGLVLDSGLNWVIHCLNECL